MISRHKNDRDKIIFGFTRGSDPAELEIEEKLKIHNVDESQSPILEMMFLNFWRAVSPKFLRDRTRERYQNASFLVLFYIQLKTRKKIFSPVTKI